MQMVITMSSDRGIQRFAGVYPHQRIELTFESRSFKNPGHVLVYAFYENQLLFTHHRQRGWELPGGKCHAHERPIDAAIREVYEETGAVLSSLQPIAQYRIIHPKEALQIKTIYAACIQKIHPLPIQFETDGRQLLCPVPHPDHILNHADYSPLLKDDVYRLTRPAALAAIATMNRLPKNEWCYSRLLDTAC